MQKLKYIWKDAFSDNKFILEFLGALVLLIVIMIIFSYFVQTIEQRNGVQLNDPFQYFYQAKNLTWPIFIMIYGAILSAIAILVFYPAQLVLLFEAYALMVLIRLIMMYFVPLEPPLGMILLKDPLVEFFGGGKTLTKDLFFSGHTASLVLLALAAPKKVKWLFFSLAWLVALSVLVQKVHYTIDVLVAPFISFFAYDLSSRIKKKLIHE